MLKEVRQLADLAERPVLDVPVADGYRIVQWIDHAADDLVDGLAHLCARMSTDAPQEEMDWEPEVWDAARYRAKEASAGARGRTRYAGAAVHEATGQVAAMTDIGLSRLRPDIAYQWDTIVLHEHRRSRPRPRAEVAQPRPARRVVAGDALDQHLERRGQHAHDRDQRAAGLRAGRVLDRVAARPLTGTGFWPTRPSMRSRSVPATSRAPRLLLIDEPFHGFRGCQNR